LFAAFLFAAFLFAAFLFATFLFAALADTRGSCHAVAETIAYIA
jgi:hypothetical protein